MRTHPEKLKPFLLAVFGYGALGSVLVIGDQIRRIYYKINKATSCDVLSIYRFQPTYIYIEDPFIQEEISAGISISKERLKLTRFHKWLYDKIEESFIFRNWYSYKKNLPWRYLRLAQDENQSYRLRAVRSLASMNTLADAEYSELAQACDMRTAVGLARTIANEKFLLDPPYFKMKPDKKAIIKNFHDFFIALDNESRHPCLKYFVSKVIVDVSDLDSKVFDDDLRFSFDNTDFIPLCLEALLHHSWTDVNARQIINLGGLPLLMEVYKYLKQNEPEQTDSLIVLSKILSNISVCSDSAKSFFMTGWMKILLILSQHKDIRISAPAQRALANFDTDDPPRGKGEKFSRRVYLLHPTQRTLAQPKLDVVFIHGLLGGIFITWRQRDSGHCTHKSPLELLGLTASDDEKERMVYQTMKPLDQDFFVDVSDLNNWDKIADSYEFVLSDIPVDSNSKCCGPFYGSPNETDCNEGFTKCWPKDWLAQDCPDIRLIGINYETNISRWTPLCPISNTSGTLQERSQHLMNILSQAGVGKRPIVWIGHSMGGLLVKGVLNLFLLNIYERSRTIAQNLTKPFHDIIYLIQVVPNSYSISYQHRGVKKGEECIQFFQNNIPEDDAVLLHLCFAECFPYVPSNARLNQKVFAYVRESKTTRNSSDPAERLLLEQTKGIVFYSTPHKGSHLAALNMTSQMIVWPSVEVQELRENYPGLLELHDQFLDTVRDSPIRVISFAERESTYVTSLKFEIRFVDSHSADPDVGEHYGIPLDHLSICKPSGRQSFLYQKVKKLIQEIISEMETGKS